MQDKQTKTRQTDKNKTNRQKQDKQTKNREQFMDITNIIGYSATAVGISMMTPQLYKSLTTKKVHDVSLGMLLLYFLNCFLWGIYSILIASNPVIIANGAGLLISMALLVLKVKYE